MVKHLSQQEGDEDRRFCKYSPAAPAQCLGISSLRKSNGLCSPEDETSGSTDLLDGETALERLEHLL